MAKLYFRYGAMGSSKTANALMVQFNYEERGQNALLMKPEIDNRDGAEVVKSRIGLESKAFIIKKDMDLSRHYKTIMHFDCLIVDEAQFLTKEQVHQLSDIVDELDIPVICYGLRCDFQGNLFPGSAALLALADTIEEIKTICWCGKKATISMRLEDGKPIYKGDQVKMGGNESYVAVCRKHWKEGKYK